MKVEGLVRFEWANVLKTHVNVISVYGNMKYIPVADLPTRLQNERLLAPIKAIYEDILKWVNDENKDANPTRTDPRS